MADGDQIFLATDRPAADVARRVAQLLRLEYVRHDSETGETQYRGPARSFDGWVGFFVGPNDFAPEPGERQAMDGYSVMVDVQARHRKDAQGEEARLAFEALVAAWPEVAGLLVDNVEILVAAYLPGAGTEYFAPGVTVDEPDREAWLPWVTARDS